MYAYSSSSSFAFLIDYSFFFLFEIIKHVIWFLYIFSVKHTSLLMNISKCKVYTCFIQGFSHVNLKFKWTRNWQISWLNKINNTRCNIDQEKLDIFREYQHVQLSSQGRQWTIKKPCISINDLFERQKCKNKQIIFTFISLKKKIYRQRLFFYLLVKKDVIWLWSIIVVEDISLNE